MLTSCPHGAKVVDMDTNALTTTDIETLLAEHRDEILAMDSDEETVDLTDDGEVIARLRILPDDITLMDEAGEGMWCGKLAWPSRRTNAYGYHERPAGYDGNAELLGVHQGHTQAWDQIWWQPPSDVPRTDEHFAALRQNVIDVLEDGYDVVVLEVCAGRDVYRRPIAILSDSLGAVHASGEGVLEDVLSDLIANIIPEQAAAA